MNPFGESPQDSTHHGMASLTLSTLGKHSARGEEIQRGHAASRVGHKM